MFPLMTQPCEFLSSQLLNTRESKSQSFYAKRWLWRRAAMPAPWNSPIPSPECYVLRPLLWAVEMNLSTWAFRHQCLLAGNVC